MIHRVALSCATLLLGAGHALAVPSERPAPLTTVPFQAPAVDKRQLSNGLDVWITVNREMPVFTVSLTTPRGGWTDPLGRRGLAEVTLQMMLEGAGDKTAAEVAQQARAIGAELSATADADMSQLGVEGISRNLDPTLDLWASVLLKPSFPPEEWERIRQRQISDLAVDKTELNHLASVGLNRLLYGDAYRGVPATESSYNTISIQDISKWYQTNIVPDGSVVLIGGDVDPDAVIKKLEELLGQWRGASRAVPPAPPARPVADEAMHFVHIPGAEQTMLAAASLLPPIGDDHADMEIGNATLGGSFVSRLNLNLREDKGWTYGASCHLDYKRMGPGRFVCYTSVQSDVSIDALTEMRAEIDRFLGERPATADEVRYFTSAAVNDFPAGFETTTQILGTTRDGWLYQWPEDYLATYLTDIQATTADSVNGAFRRNIDMDQLRWIVIGDRDNYEAGLAGLGLPVVELDDEGKPKSRAH